MTATYPETLEVPEASEPRGLQAWAFPLAVWAGARVALIIASWAAMKVEPRVMVPTWLAPEFRLLPALEPLCRWDCGWYYLIARDGYMAREQVNFFPLLPLLTRALSTVTRLPLNWALLLVTNVSTLLAYRVLFRMFRRLSDEQTARWALLLAASYPFAFFYAAGHTEPLMVLLSALAIDYATRGQHVRAGLALAVGGLSRHLTLLAGLGLVVAQVQQRPSLGRFFKSPAWLALALPWAGLAAYCVYQQLVWGDFLAFYRARDAWGSQAYWGLAEQLKAFSSPEGASPIITTYMPFAALVLVGVLLTFRQRTWWPLAAFGLIFIAIIWVMGLGGAGRYSASCWPAFLGLGAFVARRPTLGMLLVSGMGVLQGIFFFLFAHQYGVM